jgi:hypothetical protein
MFGISLKKRMELNRQIIMENGMEEKEYGVIESL